ncbi:hypothetical protein BH23CHL2_BH23CHL2_11660 [soil metagenome]
MADEPTKSTTQVRQLRPVGLPRFPGGGLPEPETARKLFRLRTIAIVALVSTLLYLVWRTLFTVDLGVWWVSIPLLVIEVHAFISLAFFVHTLWDVQTVRDAGVVESTDDRIAVLIPTYNESVEVLLPAVAASVALQPAHETWVLDDGQRPHIRDLAESLGAKYLSRPNNEYAKAGNINHALQYIEADLVAILDADHVPTPEFLTKTLGYFDDPDIALVQTPQDFYNMESFEHEGFNSTLDEQEQQLYHEQAMFYRVIQPGKNRVGGAFWCGTCAVVRVEALNEVGGIATETITEDIHTTIRMHRRGWKTIYHNEVLARGLAAADASQYQLQRFRWGIGAMQVLRKENPFFVSGLTMGQRLSYAMTMLGWFDAWRMLGFILVPPVVLLTGAVPIRAHPEVFILAFGIPFLLQRWALRQLSRGYYREKMQLVFEIVRMAPNVLATLTLILPGSRTFQVTPKGRTDEYRERQRASILLLGLLGAISVAGVWYLLTLAGLTPVSYRVPWAAHGAAIWLVVNGVIVALAIRRVMQSRYAGERRSSVRFVTHLTGRINDRPCRIDDMSLTGARVVLKGLHSVSDPAELAVEVGNQVIVLQVTPHLIKSDLDSAVTICGLEFVAGQFRQRSALALALFNAQSVGDEPGEFQADPIVA